MTADDAKSLRIVTFAGEAVTPDLLEMSEKICPSAELANEYGPTENSVATTILRQLNEKRGSRSDTRLRTQKYLFYTEIKCADRRGG